MEASSVSEGQTALENQIKWSTRTASFKTEDTDWNKPPNGKWDTAEGKTADWYVDKGPKTVGTKNYKHYVDKK